MALTDNERKYVLKVLQEKKEMLQITGPCTDRPEVSEWRVRALESAALDLQEPSFEVNPFA